MVRRRTEGGSIVTGIGGVQQCAFGRAGKEEAIAATAPSGGLTLWQSWALVW